MTDTHMPTSTEIDVFLDAMCDYGLKLHFISTLSWAIPNKKGPTLYGVEAQGKGGRDPEDFRKDILLSVLERAGEVFIRPKKGDDKRAVNAALMNGSAVVVFTTPSKVKAWEEYLGKVKNIYPEAR